MTDKANDPVIVSAVRTPIGVFGGSLKAASHEQLAVTVLKEVCERVEFSKDLVDDVYWGTVMVRSDENGLARGAVLKAGYPDDVTAVQVNRACCSSMEAIRIASMEIRLGESQSGCGRWRGEHEQCFLQPQECPLGNGLAPPGIVRRHLGRVV